MTGADRDQLRALNQIISAVEAIHVTSNNSDVVAALASLRPNNSDVVAALASLRPNNADVVTALQNLTYTTILAKLDSVIAAINAKSPILKASTARLSEILTAAIPANTPVKLFSVNANRVGYTVYNNSTNSLYVGPNNSPAGGRLFFQLGTNAGTAPSLPVVQCFGPNVWTGELWVVRNSGTGGVVGYEFEP